MMLGKILLTIDALGLLIGAPLADLNETHMYNPRWSPHAKFHNAQTINLAVLLSIITLYYTWRSARDGLGVAAVAGSIYWLAGLAAILYPGTSGLDPEFGGPACPQLVPFTAFAGLAVAGWALEVAW